MAASCRARPPGLSKEAAARVPPVPSHVTPEEGSQDPLHVTPRGRDPPHVTGGGSQETSSRDRGEGAREPVARPGPAPSSLALSTPGSGARRSHDLWGRGCRSERAGEPGAAATKAEEARRGRRRPPGRLRTLSYLCRSRPAGSREDRKEALGTRAPPSPPRAFTCAQVYAGEANLINNTPHPGLSRISLVLGSAKNAGAPRGWWGTQAPRLRALHCPRDSSGAGGGRVSLGEGDKLDRPGESAPNAPGVLRVPLREEGPHPHSEVSKESERGGCRWLIPTPSLTLRARGGRGGGAEPQTTKSGAASGSPSPGRLEVAAAGPCGSSPLGPRHCSRVAPPPGGSPRQCRRRRLGRCDSDPRVPRDHPQHTDTHGGGRGDPHGGSAGRRRQGQRGLSRMRIWPRSRHPAAAPHTRETARPP